MVVIDEPMAQTRIDAFAQLLQPVQLEKALMSNIRLRTLDDQHRRIRGRADLPGGCPDNEAENPEMPFVAEHHEISSHLRDKAHDRIRGVAHANFSGQRGVMFACDGCGLRLDDFDHKMPDSASNSLRKSGTHSFVDRSSRRARYCRWMAYKCTRSAAHCTSHGWTCR